MLKISCHGYTLLEIMLVLGLVSILSFISLETDTNHTAEAERLLAIHRLMQAAANLEGYALTHGNYAGASLASLSLPAGRESGYHFFVSTTQNTYALSAIPNQTEAPCGRWILTENQGLTHTGAGLGCVATE